MKIKVRKSDRNILEASIHSSGDQFINMDYDPNTEVVYTVGNDQTICGNYWKYRYIDGQYVLIPTYTLEITTSAVDTDGDGYPDIEANGTDSCTVTIRKLDNQGVISEGTDEIWVSTTNGRINFIHGNLVNGQKVITLISSTETVLADIKIIAKNSFITDGRIQIMFRPPAE